MKPKDPTKNMSFPTEITRQVCEHEVLLSFNDDISALAFHDWWREQGADHFKKWFETNSENYDD